jgi:serine/threonine protein kinase
MAPEIINGQEHTTAADAYAFAILTLELMTGQDAYPQRDFPAIWHVTKFVTEGKRPPIPQDMPTPVSALIQACWAADPRQRPNFATIVEDVTGHISMIGLLEVSDQITAAPTWPGKT